MESPSVILLRTEFALSIANHYLFVPTSIGLIFLVAVMHTMALGRARSYWTDAAAYWSHLFVLTWIMGVITGFPLRWQLTNNWRGFENYLKEILGRILVFE